MTASLAPGNCLGAVQRGAGPQQRLGWHAGPVGALAAHQLRFHQDRRQAAADHPVRHVLAHGAGADHNDIEFPLNKTVPSWQQPTPGAAWPEILARQCAVSECAGRPVQDVGHSLLVGKVRGRSKGAPHAARQVVPPARFSAQARLRALQSDIMELILDRDLEPGDARCRPRTSCAAALGVGRNTLRESLKVLQALGVIEIRHGFGMFVAPSNFEALTDGLTFRGRLSLRHHGQEALQLVDVRQALEAGLIGSAMDRDHRRNSWPRSRSP